MTNRSYGKKSIWQKLWSPSGMTLGSIVIIGMVAGVLFWGGFNWSLEITNTEEFCVSCHEMRENVFEEYKETIHYANRSGVRATCPDCHVPKEWVWKVGRKIQATRELYGKVMGTISTREKFLDKRLQLAMNEWRRMKANNSRECRNCHDYEYMDYSEQGHRSARIHPQGFEKGKTCIDCHKGIAHELPEFDEAEVNALLEEG